MHCNPPPPILLKWYFLTLTFTRSYSRYLALWARCTWFSIHLIIVRICITRYTGISRIYVITRSTRSWNILCEIGTVLPTYSRTSEYRGMSGDVENVRYSEGSDIWRSDPIHQIWYFVLFCVTFSCINPAIIISKCTNGLSRNYSIL